MLDTILFLIGTGLGCGLAICVIMLLRIDRHLARDLADEHRALYTRISSLRNHLAEIRTATTIHHAQSRALHALKEDSRQ